MKRDEINHGATSKVDTMTETTPPLEASPVLRESISLTERFPNCFNWNRVRPLKIGIHRDLWAILGESHARVEIRRLLSRYCNHARYRHALKEGAVLSLIHI